MVPRTSLAFADSPSVSCTTFPREKASIAQKMAHLNRNIRLVFDYLQMTRNSVGNAQA
jgi:hypothetical protein